MKRPTLATRYENANKAQENPYGIIVVSIIMFGALVLRTSLFK